MKPTKNELTRDDLRTNGFSLLQPRRGYRFSLDAVLLAAFAPLAENGDVVDFGCGSGILPLLLLGREPSLNITAVERMAAPFALAKKNMAANRVKVKVIRGDVCRCDAFLPAANADLVITNPPFYPVNAVRLPQNEEIAAAKTELYWNQRQMLRQAHRLLRPEGRLALIFTVERKREIIEIAADCGFYLERSVVVCSREGEPPRRVCLQWQKKPVSATAETTLTIYDQAGEMTPAMKRILEVYNGTGLISGGDAHRQP